MTNTPCPDKAKLELMLLGKLPPAELESVGEHFLHCNACANVAETIPASDGLTAAIQARKIFSGDEELLAQAIERAKGLRSQLQTADGQINATTEMQGQATQPNPSVPALDYDLDFLALAEQPDELGRLGGYRILEVMGVGGMGLVFRAEDPKLERMVALKVMKPTIAASKSAKDRFLREAKATAALDHHNIVQIFQVGEDRGVPYIAMQYLRGESLQTRLSRDKQLAQADVLRIGREVADGLQVAHDRGLIHRDIKPDNIWLDAKTGAGKLLDFGLARAAADNAGLTQDGTVLGTPRYMSPEQSLGQTVDFRCDLFSLGSVLYHLAAGRPAFDGSNLTATLIAVAQANPQSIDKLAPTLHPDLSRLIMRLLAKDRDQRPQSAAEVSRTIADIEKQLAAARVEPLAPTIEIRPKVDRSLRDRSTSSHGVTRLLCRTPVFLRSSIALAALAFLIACGVIIIKITNKDGTTVEITLPDDVKKVEITESEIPNLKSEIPNSPSWHGWPADAPPPAIAPFDAAQAKQHQQAWADYLKLPVDYTNSIGMKFVFIPPGEFTMGSSDAEIAAEIARSQGRPLPGYIRSEGPQRMKRFKQAIYLGTHEVSQREYSIVMGTMPTQESPNRERKGQSSGLNEEPLPVVMVDWNNAVTFCKNLSELYAAESNSGAGTSIVGVSADAYRLPSEAEWEFSCRGGTLTRFWSGDRDEDLQSAGWFGGNSGGATKAVGMLAANPFGLHDVHGNVWEWCIPGTASESSPNAQSDSTSPANQPVPLGTACVVRGGDCWALEVSFCRSASRLPLAATARFGNTGFRVSLHADALEELLKRQEDAAGRTAPLSSDAPIDFASERQVPE